MSFQQTGLQRSRMFRAFCLSGNYELTADFSALPSKVAELVDTAVASSEREFPLASKGKEYGLIVPQHLHMCLRLNGRGIRWGRSSVGSEKCGLLERPPWSIDSC